MTVVIYRSHTWEQVIDPPVTKHIELLRRKAGSPYLGVVSVHRAGSQLAFGVQFLSPELK